MAVFGDLAGQPITLNNAAEEATMQRIESLLAGMQGGGGGGQAAAQAAQQRAKADQNAAAQVAGLGAGAGAAAAGLYDSARAARMYNQASMDFQRGMSSMSQNFQSADPYAFSQSLVSTMGNIASTLGEGILGTIPVVGDGLGKLASRLAQGAAFLAGTFIGVLSKTAGSFKTAQQSGALLGGDLIKFRQAANGSGLTLDQFNGVLQKAGSQMASFGGQTTAGSNAFGNANKALISGYGEQMLRMGIDYEEMGVRSAEYMETLQLSGMSLGQMSMQADDVAAGAARLAKQQKMLAAINGESVEQQKQRQKQARSDAAFQAALQGMNAKQRTEMEALITQFPHLSQAIKETIVTGDAVSAEAIMAVQAAGKQGEIILGGVRNIAEGVAPEEQMSAIYRNLEANSATIARETAAAAETVKMGILGVNSAFVNAYTEQFLPLQRASTQAGAKVFSNVEKDMLLLEQDSSAATKAVTSMSQSMQKAQQAVSTAVTDLLNSSFGADLAKLAAWPVNQMAGLVAEAPALAKKMAEISGQEATNNTQTSSQATPTTPAVTTPDAASAIGNPDFMSGLGLGGMTTNDTQPDATATTNTANTTSNMSDVLTVNDPALNTAMQMLQRKIDDQTTLLVRALQNM
jgi:hypothetical protein